MAAESFMHGGGSLALISLRFTSKNNKYLQAAA
jgi:hypothetical protein